MLREEEKQRRVKEVTKKIIIIQLIGSIGTIMVGLGIYAIFGANGDAFHPLLNNMNIVYSMLALGGVIMLWEFVTFIKLVNEKNRINREP